MERQSSQETGEIYSEFENIEDLKMHVREMGEIRGSSHNFSAETVISQIEEIMTNVDSGKYLDSAGLEIDLLRVTRTGGIRHNLRRFAQMAMARRG